MAKNLRRSVLFPYRTSKKQANFIGPRRGCAPTSCSACWPIICNGTCAAASPRCCSTSLIRQRARRSAPHRWPRPSPPRRRNARPPANPPTQQMANRSRCTASTPCSVISPRSPAMSSASGAIASPPSSHPHPHTTPRPRSARRYAHCVDRPTPSLHTIPVVALKKVQSSG